MIIVPVKRPAIGKSRMRSDARVTEPLVRAIAMDTITAAAAGAEVLVVTDDDLIAAAAAGLGARVCPDPPGAGLNAAIRHGESIAGLTRARIALTADLPALRPSELDAAIDAASGTTRAFVADHHGTGTALLWAGRGVPLDPRFGPGSARRHAASGARPLSGDWPSLRLDVDTVADLVAAASLGVGDRTAGYMVINQIPVT